MSSRFLIAILTVASAIHIAAAQSSAPASNLKSNIDTLSSFDYSSRMNAARALRRVAPEARRWHRPVSGDVFPRASAHATVRSRRKTVRERGRSCQIVRRACLNFSGRLTLFVLTQSASRDRSTGWAASEKDNALQ